MKSIIDARRAKQRVEQLKKEIYRHRYAYHVLDKETISPNALDSLKKELFDLEQQFPQFVTPDSPTQRVGGKPLDSFKKVRHEQPMLSFNDAFNEKDIKEWVRRLESHVSSVTDFYCELKIDGLAIELIYESGVLIQGSTRGDGAVGEDVTQNLRTIEAIPLKLHVPRSGFRVPRHIIVRGEVFLAKKEFERINKERVRQGEQLYANPRNIAAGSIRQLDPKVIAGRKLDALAYDIALPAEVLAKTGITAHEEEHKLLKQLGFKVNLHNKRLSTIKEVFNYRDYWEKKRDALPYEVDGVVVIVNNNSAFEKAGVVGKAPRAAIAYKFSPKEATTVIKGIKVQVGRTGALTPVAVMEPVKVGGITITHATLHNYDQIKRLGIRIGDTVVISRAGDVIPQVTKVLTDLRTGDEKEFRMPAQCPIDGSKITKAGVIHRCSNPQCGARNREFLSHFASRPAFNIDGMGPRVIDRFLDEGLISDAADLFVLQKGDIAVLKGFGRKSAENIVAEAEKSKNINLSRFLYSLGIFHVGEETARLLAERIFRPRRTILGLAKPTDVLKVLQEFSIIDLQEIPDVGPEVANSIYSWFHSKRNIALLKKLEKVGVTIKRESLRQKGKFHGKKFVLTGALVLMTREEAKEKIRGAGGAVSENVSKTTDYVVAGNNPGSKYNEAKERRIPIITEQKFLALLK